MCLLFSLFMICFFAFVAAFMKHLHNDLYFQPKTVTLLQTHNNCLAIVLKFSALHHQSIVPFSFWSSIDVVYCCCGRANWVVGYWEMHDRRREVAISLFDYSFLCLHKVLLTCQKLTIAFHVKVLQEATALKTNWNRKP